MSEFNLSIEEVIRSSKERKQRETEAAAEAASSRDACQKAEAIASAKRQELQPVVARLITNDLVQTARILKGHGIQPNVVLEKHVFTDEEVPLEGLKGFFGKTRRVSGAVNMPIASVWTLTAMVRQTSRDEELGMSSHHSYEESAAYRHTRGLAVSDDERVYVYEHTAEIDRTSFGSLKSSYPDTKWARTDTVSMTPPIRGHLASTDEIVPISVLDPRIDSNEQPFINLIRDQVKSLAAKLV